MKKKLGKFLRINDRVYRAGFSIYFGGDYVLAANEFKNFVGFDFNVPEITSDAHTFYNTDFKNVMIWFKEKYPSPCLVAHECFHAAHYILGRTGLKLTDDSEEAYAYYLEYLIREISYSIARKHRPERLREHW